jgi:hypothetical protein
MWIPASALEHSFVDPTASSACSVCEPTSRRFVLETICPLRLVTAYRLVAAKTPIFEVHVVADCDDGVRIAGALAVAFGVVPDRLRVPTLALGPRGCHDFLPLRRPGFHSLWIHTW